MYTQNIKISYHQINDKGVQFLCLKDSYISYFFSHKIIFNNISLLWHLLFITFNALRVLLNLPGHFGKVYLHHITKRSDNMWSAIQMPTFKFCAVLGSTKIYNKQLWVMLYLGWPCHPRTNICDNNRNSTHIVTVNKRRDQHTLSWRSGVLETRVRLWCHQDLLRDCLLIIAASSMILVSWLACKLKQRNNDAALFSGKNLIKYMNWILPKMTWSWWKIIKIRPIHM